MIILKVKIYNEVVSKTQPIFLERYLSEIDEYLKKVESLQKKGLFSADFLEGYYLSKDKKLRKTEEDFLETIPKIKNFIINTAKKEKNKKKLSLLLHLLGWSKDYKKTPSFLMGYIDYDNVSIGNAAMRSLFPMVASGKFAPKIKKINNLTYKRSKYVKNKSLGILAFIKKDIKYHVDKKYIEKLVKSKIEMVRGPAKMVLDRLK